MAASPSARLTPVGFADIDGWSDDDHLAAWQTFRRSAERLLASPPTTKPLGPDASGLRQVAAAALRSDIATQAAARAFFEAEFTAVRVEPAEGRGFVTAYFEPEVAASLEASAALPVPIYGRPADLVEIGADDDRGGLDPALSWARRLADGRLGAFPDRGAIMDGAIAGQAPVLAYVANWVEALFIHIQGSARLVLPDGAVKRITFAGKSGHPYSSLGRLMVERGLMTAAEATADRLKAWLLGLDEAERRAVLGRNRSFIFFRPAPVDDAALGPVAAAGVPLTPGRSLAVDRGLITFHAPIFVEADLGDVAGRWHRLMVAQDTGSAIVGPARGDLFIGTGEAAWAIAARVRHPARFTLLVPKGAPT